MKPDNLLLVQYGYRDDYLTFFWAEHQGNKYIHVSPGFESIHEANAWLKTIESEYNNAMEKVQ